MENPVRHTQSLVSTTDWAAPVEVQKELREVLEAEDMPKVRLLMWKGPGSRMEVEQRATVDDLKRYKAKRFVDLIIGGKSPTAAAKALNTKLSTMKSKKEVQDLIEETVSNYHVPAQGRKFFAQALLMKIATEQDVSTPEGAKVALQALKQMGDDAEVGMYGAKAAPASGPQLNPALMALLGPAEGAKGR